MLRLLCCLLLGGFLLSACHTSIRKKWSIAVPIHNSKYEGSSTLLKELLIKEGIELEIIPVASGIEAGQLVADGKVDFMFGLAHSDFIISRLGNRAKDLRTTMPFFENAIFIFYRLPKKPASIIELAENSKIYLEVRDSLAEQNLSLRRLFGMLNVKNYEFVHDSSEATITPIWGPFSGEVAKKMLNKKWKIYSLEQPFINYALIIEPRFGQLTIPGKYPDEGTSGISTLLSTAFLITNKYVDKTELYDFVNLLYQNRAFFTTHDKSYRAMSEEFNAKDLNFPLHAATSAYLVRNEPTFLERNAEYYGLILSVLIIAFGAFQSFRNYMTQKKKDRIDIYFLEYLRIKKDDSLNEDQKLQLLDDLYTKALNQMVVEKLSISDFNIFSQTIKPDRIRSTENQSTGDLNT